MSEYDFTLPQVTETVHPVDLRPLAPVNGQTLEFVENEIEAHRLLLEQSEQLNRVVEQMNALGRAANAARAAAGAAVYFDAQGAARHSPEYFEAFAEAEIVAETVVNVRWLVVDNIAPSEDRPLSEVWLAERNASGFRWAGPLVSSFAATLPED